MDNRNGGVGIGNRGRTISPSLPSQGKARWRGAPLRRRRAAGRSRFGIRPARLDAQRHFVIIPPVANPDGRALLDSRGGPYRPGADDTGTVVLPALRSLSQRGPDRALPVF